MKKISIMAKGVVIAVGMVGIAYADNTWTGFYAGVDAGVVVNDVQLRSQQLGFTNPGEHCNANSDFSTFFPGIQAGYKYQFPNYLVAGIEANITFNTTQKEVLHCVCPINTYVSDRFTFRYQLQNAIKGQVGRVINWNQSNVLPYVTAGASFAKVRLSYHNEGGDYYSSHVTQPGWLIGAGIEWAFLQYWSLAAEYAYLDYGNTITLNIPSVYSLRDPNGKAHVDLRSNNVVVAINYWIK